jgi:hypothetical protein
MTRRTRSPWPDRIAVAKDLILFGLGTALIAWQGFVVPPKDLNLSVMIFGGVVSGAPGMVYLWQLQRESRSSTEDSSSEDLPPPSALPSQPSSGM